MIRRLAAGGAVLLATAAAAAPAGAAAGTGVRVKITPASPDPSSTLTVSFRLPEAVSPPAGPVSDADVLERSDEVAVRGPAHGSGCVSTSTARVPAARKGATVHVRLRPSSSGGRWCIGSYKGDILQSAQPTCSPTPHTVCPMYLTVPQVIGRFHFTVTAH